MKTYKSKHNTVVDETGKQVAVILPVSCTMKAARAMAAFAAQQMNHDERNRNLRSAVRAAAAMGRKSE